MGNVIVLLSTYNGSRYLREQIESLVAQEGVNLKILVRDDGSTDETKSILEDYQSKGVLTWYKGPNLKPARSFLDLLVKAPSADYYAFCDQDDVWLPNKLNVALEKLNIVENNKPGLYFSEKYYVDSSLKLIRKSQSVGYQYSFFESLVDCNCTGCTMVINKPLKELLVKAIPEYIEMHDSWIFRFCLACGGKVIHDDDAYIYYRQHENNVIGANDSKINRIKRYRALLLSNKGNERLKTCEELYRDKDLFSDGVVRLLATLCSYRVSLRFKIKLIFQKESRLLRRRRYLRFIMSLLLNKF
jgi:rhamnosyltransferase